MRATLGEQLSRALLCRPLPPSKSLYLSSTDDDRARIISISKRLRRGIGRGRARPLPAANERTNGWALGQCGLSYQSIHGMMETTDEEEDHSHQTLVGMRREREREREPF